MQEFQIYDVQFNIPGMTRVPVENILNEVSVFHGVSVEDIKSPSRYAKHTLPRYEAMWIMEKLCGLSMRKIGQHFSNRDHASVHYGIHQMNRNIVEEKVEGDDLIMLLQRMPNVSWKEVPLS